MTLENRTLLITGINRGLGRHLAEQVLEAGGRVAGTARNPNSLQALQARHGDRLRLFSLDLTDSEQITSVVNEAFSTFSLIDAVISNAAYSLLGAAEEVEPKQIRHLLETNLVGSILLARAALPYFRRQGGGRLIQISSSSGHAGLAGLSLYCASKWGIEGFYESLGQEVEPFGIQTTLVEPGAIRTDFGTTGVVSEPLEAYQGTPAHQFRHLADFQAPGDPSKMARAILDTLEGPAPTRLVLGQDAYQMIHHGMSSRLVRLELEGAVPTDHEPVTL